MPRKNKFFLCLSSLLLASLFCLPVLAEEESSKKDSVFLSDIPMCSYSWLDGTKSPDGTVTGKAPGMDRTITAGSTICIAGVEFEKGLCYHPAGDGQAEISFDISSLTYSKFTAVAGKDLEATGAYGVEYMKENCAVQFWVLLDGEVAASSPPMFYGESHTFSVDITGKSTLTLRVTDGGDGIVCDTASWGNAALTNAKGDAVSLALTRPLARVYQKGEPLHYFNTEVVTTYDTGIKTSDPLTDAMISGYDPNQLGEQQVTIRHQGLTLSLPVYVVSDICYVSDISWSSFVALDNVEPSRDRNRFGENISVGGMTFEKGLRTHPSAETQTAEIRYDISQQRYTMFSAVVGKDKEASAELGEEAVGATLVQFEVILDGEVVASSPNLAYGDAYYLFADITGGSELILRVNAVDGIAFDSSSFGNALFSSLEEPPVETGDTFYLLFPALLLLLLTATMMIGKKRSC